MAEKTTTSVAMKNYQMQKDEFDAMKVDRDYYQQQVDDLGDILKDVRSENDEFSDLIGRLNEQREENLQEIAQYREVAEQNRIERNDLTKRVIKLDSKNKFFKRIIKKLTK